MKFTLDIGKKGLRVRKEILDASGFQKEAALQVEKGEETVSNCSGVNLLPSRMRIVMTNSTTPDEVTDERVTAQTLWIETPGGDELPRIILQ